MPVVTAKAPRWSPRPVSRGATKSASERFGSPLRLGALLAQEMEAARAPSRAPRPRRAATSSPTALAGKKPVDAARRAGASSRRSRRAARWPRRRSSGPARRTSRARGSAGRRPCSSQVWKNGVQSMNSRSVASGKSSRTRTPVKLRLGDVLGAPLDGRAVRARGLERRRACASVRACELPELLVLGAVLRDERRLALGAEEARRHGHGAARVEHVDDRLAVVRRDLHRRVRAAGRGAADEQRQLEALSLHLARDVRHLVERRRDEARQADEVRLLRLGALEDLLARHHDAQVDDLVVVAGEHDADDVLADVVHVALDRGEHDLALGLRACPAAAMAAFSSSMNGVR